MTEPAVFKYRAFLSYSHADTKRAKWLHGRLESFPIDKELVGRETGAGPIPKSLRPIFRDRDEFTAGHGLAEQTIAALDASAALIVLCSPASAKSRYVNEEVRLFKSRHPDRPVIPVIAEGQPGNPETEPFPLAVRFAIAADGSITADPVEVLAADIAADGEEVALAKVVAPLIGLGTDEVFQRAQRAQRRRQRFWIAGLSGVAIVLAGLAVWAEINRREAVTQREEAERNFAVAKQGADALVFDIAQGLRNVEGMRAETVRKILGRAEEAFAKLVERSGDNRELVASQAAMLLEFADTYAAQGDTAKQIESARASLATFDRLAQSDSGRPGYQMGRAAAYSRIGDSLTAQGSLPEALTAYSQSLSIADGLLKSDPVNKRTQQNRATFQDKVANTLLEQGDLAGALKGYRESLSLREKLARTPPEDTNAKRALSISYIKVGEVHRAQGQLPEALKAYSESAAIFSELARADTTSVQWQRDLSVAKERIGDTLSARASSEKMAALSE